MVSKTGIKTSVSTAKHTTVHKALCYNKYVQQNLLVVKFGSSLEKLILMAGKYDTSRIWDIAHFCFNSKFILKVHFYSVC